MRRAGRSKYALLPLAALMLLSGCVDQLIHDANRAPCNGLPDAAKRDCLQRRGENPNRPFYSMTDRAKESSDRAYGNSALRS